MSLQVLVFLPLVLILLLRSTEAVADLAWIRPCLEDSLKEQNIPLPNDQDQDQEECEPSPDHCEVIAHGLLQEQEAKVPFLALNRSVH